MSEQYQPSLQKEIIELAVNAGKLALIQLLEGGAGITTWTFHDRSYDIIVKRREQSRPPSDGHDSEH